MSTFSTAVSGVWGALGSTLSTATGAADLASGWVRKHQIIQRHSSLGDVELAISTKSVEVDKQLQRNAEARLVINQNLVDQERQRISAILTSL